MPATPVHNTAVADGAWDANAQVAKLSPPIVRSVGFAMYGWYDASADDTDGDGYPDAKSAWKFPHHEVSANGKPGAANLNGVRNAMSRLPQSNIPEADQAAVRRHLQNHLDAQQNSRPPRDGLVRALLRVTDAEGEVTGCELRESTVDGRLGTLAGHFAVFNRWTEIDSIFEGRFLERIAPGAFKKTISEQRDAMRVLFQHGQDPTVGDKPLGPIETLSEDEVGAAYEVPLLDTSYNRDLLPGLKAGLYGASFRFRVLREEIDGEPGASEENPNALPERTVKEAQVMEFGPVTFPAYAEATAGVRSLTDEFVFEPFTRDSARLRQLVDFIEARDGTRPEDRREAKQDEEKEVSQDGAGAEPHPAPVSQETTDHLYGERRQERPSWLL